MIDENVKIEWEHGKSAKGYVGRSLVCEILSGQVMHDYHWRVAYHCAKFSSGLRHCNLRSAQREAEAIVRALLEDTARTTEQLGQAVRP